MNATLDYSRDAIDFMDRIEVKRVVLINGKQLAQLRIEHDVGVLTLALTASRKSRMTSSKKILASR